MSESENQAVEATADEMPESAGAEAAATEATEATEPVQPDAVAPESEATAEVAAAAPASEEPVVEGTVAEGTVVAEPVAEETVAEETVAEEPAAAAPEATAATTAEDAQPAPAAGEAAPAVTAPAPAPTPAPDVRTPSGPNVYKPTERRGRVRRIGNDVTEDEISYRNISLLSRFLDGQGRIHSRRKTRVSAKVQRRVVKAIKRARQIALLPYTGDHSRIVRKRR